MSKLGEEGKVAVRNVRKDVLKKAGQVGDLGGWAELGWLWCPPGSRCWPGGPACVTPAIGIQHCTAVLARA